MSNKEIWKPIAFEGKKPSVKYAVSSHGRFGVYGEKGKIEVREIKPQNGVYRYNYKINGQSKAIFIYKEVAKAFLKKTSPKQKFIIHKDHNYLNNRISNLKWATAEEHKQHVTFSPNSVKARAKKAIVKSATAKVFDEKTAKEVKRLIWDPKRKLSFRQIAEKYGVSEMQIYRIKRGELWFHIHVENEPLTSRYKKNLENIAWQEKQKAKAGKLVTKAQKKVAKKAKKTLKKIKKRK